MKKPACYFSGMLALSLLATGLAAQETKHTTNATTGGAASKAPNVGATAAPRTGKPADGDAISCGVHRRIQSTVLHEERKLWIRLPPDYGRGKKGYPVLYRLDGDRTVFMQTVGSVEYLRDWEMTPDFIVVGIENTDRGRDVVREVDNFIQFLKTELIPFIDQNYRTNGFRILAGQSSSAGFAMRSFLKQPDLFDAYVLSSFGIVDERADARYKGELNDNPELKKLGEKYLFVANGKKDALDLDGSRMKRGAQFLESLKQSLPATVLMQSKVYEEEGHVPFPSIYDGLKWIYSQERTVTK